MLRYRHTVVEELLGESLNVMDILNNTLNVISKSDFAAEVIKIWIIRVKRSHAAYEYDEIIALAASDMGMEYLDPVSLRKRYIEKWNKQLSILKSDYDFCYEARRLIEQTLVDDEKIPPLLTGEDIISELNVYPGPEVRKLYSLAQRLFIESPCSKDALITALRNHIKVY